MKGSAKSAAPPADEPVSPNANRGANRNLVRGIVPRTDSGAMAICHATYSSRRVDCNSRSIDDPPDFELLCSWAFVRRDLSGGIRMLLPKARGWHASRYDACDTPR